MANVLTDVSVYRQLRDSIVEGRLAPGVRLIEQSLAEQLGVSRTPVREALRHLEADGLVISERNRGAEVRRLSAVEVDDLYELRGRLESYAAELAAVRADDAQRDELQAAAAAFDDVVVGMRTEGAHDLSTTRRLNAANRWFHDALVGAARHDRLTAVLRNTVDVPLVFQALQSFDVDQLGRSALFHRLIAGAVVAGEDRRAGRLMSEHIAQGHDMIRVLIIEP